jgi:SAM-dependent methyltransferase
MDILPHSSGDGDTGSPDRIRLRTRLKSPFRRWMDCLRLNLKMAILALKGQWLSPDDTARGYDAVAQVYNETWLIHLRRATDRLLSCLPGDIPPGCIMDLGCGTGDATAALALRFPDRNILGIDVSEGMISKAKATCLSPDITFRKSDMLSYLKQASPESAAIVLSAWSIGYTNPAKVIQESAHVLAPRGIFAFIVNRMDTLGPVFRSFRLTMARFPNRIERALWPRFPKNLDAMLSMMKNAGLEVCWKEEGTIDLEEAGVKRDLSSILKTGILAGFDAVLPLRKPGVAPDYFEACLRNDPEPIRHHYIAAVARKKGDA